ncbi:uncharacterized protein LOC110859543 [Folsomia candida]|uniref:uncharacterized protein LOC110859543 n=1 Tax=Folsomia candida TaxID=158441 RepID=UPI0016054CB2|nr:uncharacterized protein LOC110859543 [Folsomia candida]
MHMEMLILSHYSSLRLHMSIWYKKRDFSPDLRKMPTCILTCQSRLRSYTDDSWEVNIFGLTSAEEKLMRSSYPEMNVCGEGVSMYLHVGSQYSVDSTLKAYRKSVHGSNSTYRDGVLSVGLLYLNFLEGHGYKVTKSHINVMDMDTRWTFILQK